MPSPPRDNYLLSRGDRARRHTRAPVQRMQRAGRYPAADCETVEAESGQLGPRDHSVLPAGDARDRLPPTRWLGFVAFSATHTHHLARVAPRALREGDWCNGCVTPGRAGRKARRAPRPGSPRDPAGRLGRWTGPWRPAAGPALPHGGWAAGSGRGGRRPARPCRMAAGPSAGVAFLAPEWRSWRRSGVGGCANRLARPGTG